MKFLIAVALPLLASCELDSLGAPPIEIPEVPCAVVHYAWGSPTSPEVIELFVEAEPAAVAQAINASEYGDPDMFNIGDETYIHRRTGTVMAIRDCWK